MANLADELLLEVLKACEQSSPEPLYPASFAAYSGLDRGLLDEALDHLRLRGLVRFTDWVREKGQGYALTSEGALVLQNPRLLKRAQVARPEPALTRGPDRADSPWARGEAVRETLLNPVRPVICMTLLGINVLVFVVGLFWALQQGVPMEAYLGSSGNLQVAAIQDKLGALFPSDILIKDQWWRLLSYAFVHGGLLHIGINMYFLFSLGPLLESLWGSVRFLCLYLVAALVGGCAVMLTLRAAVGASGALCGLLTSMGVWVYLNRRYLPPNLVSNWMRTVFTNVILIAVISMLPHVSWEGHLGGALGGALVSLPLNYQRFGRGWQKLLGLAGIVAVPALAVGIVVSQVHSTGGNREVQREAYHVQHDLFPPYRTAEESAMTAYGVHALPLLKDWDNQIDMPRVEAAKIAFERVQRQLDEALQAFDKAGPFEDHRVINTVVQGRFYLEEWSKFYALFDKVIAQARPWPAEEEHALVLHVATISQAQKLLANSALLPSVHSGKKPGG